MAAKYIRSIMLLTILSSTFLFAVAQPPGGMPKSKNEQIKNKWFDIAYASTSPSQKMDIYLPENGNGPFPVIISIHGGAFMMGDKADGQVNPMLEGLKRGYAVVSINYRMSGEAIFPTLVHDVKAAIRYVRANAAKYKLNPDKIAAWGGSAGGYLSAMAGTSGGIEQLEDLSQGNATYSSKVQAVVDWFGPIDFLQMDPQFKTSGKGKPDHSEANSPESKILGKQITLIPEQVARANPSTYISSDDPVFFIQHGSEDRLVPTEQSVNFAASLEKVMGKEKVYFEILKGANHGGPAFETAENLYKVFQFLDKHLK